LHHLTEALRFLLIHIFYRDIKPENVLINFDGHIKLCDFGFAVPLKDSGGGGGDTGGSTKLHDHCGTAMYLAPEIAGGSSRGSHGYPVDWWGLGCVLMEMVTGEETPSSQPSCP
jgi:serine/threonine protein kinase